MTRSRIILLPGLDGTGDLLVPLLAAASRDLSIRVISYPLDEPLTYDDLLKIIEVQLADEPQMILIAESYSGPLSVRYAAANPQRVQALVLCASFIRSPVPSWLRIFASSILFRLPLPNFAIRHFLLGCDASYELVQTVKRAIRKVRPRVLARRIQDVFDVDCAEPLKNCRVPILYLAAAQDALVRRSSVDSIREIRPDISIRTIDGPHLLLQRHPHEALQEIERFLAEIQRT